MAAKPLDPSDVLGWEFNYASKTADQANSDRTTVVNVYMSLVTIVSGFAVSSIGGKISLQDQDFALACCFYLLAFAGLAATAKLVRLRQAWHDSAKAMNQIKDYYIQRLPEIAEAFRWRSSTLRTLTESWTITYNLVLQVVGIDSFAFAVATYFMACHLLSPSGVWAIITLKVLSALLGGIYAFVQMQAYHFFLPGGAKPPVIPYHAVAETTAAAPLSTSPPNDLRKQSKVTKRA